MNFLEALFCGFVALALIEHISMGALPAYGEVEVVDGKCRYMNRTVQDGEDMHLEDPCQTLKCEAKKGSFAILGCGIMSSKPGCKLEKGTGVFPQCCYKSVCSKTIKKRSFV
uniref:Putative secreted salivary protein n=1 Tax=Ixodes scapularis TaxID=6945 RepID=Q4PNA0_IXOSC|nr:putative secreted salivary protein [Ixodes scapularis]